MKNNNRVRVARVFLLIILVELIVKPSSSYALTSGTHQPEFISYESAGASDMVNLITGDFTYNLPVLNVPSPEGGFALPLSYHSGIGLEDEASWVGLGWNLNVGAINRSRVGTADDALDEETDTRVTDPGGSGYVKSYGFYQKSWDSNKGYGGAFNFANIAGYSWSGNSGPLTKPRNLKDGTVMGLTFNKDKAHFDVGQAMQGLMSVGMMVGSGMMANAPVAGQAGFAAIQQMPALAARNMSGSTSYGQIGEFVTQENRGKGRVDYKYWLDATRTEHAYGSLYLGQMAKNTSITPYPSFGQDAVDRPRIGTPTNYSLAPLFKQSTYYASGHHSIVSDMHMYVAPEANYAYTLNPTSVAYDVYSVMGPGISGSMAPYRPDIGSLIYPKKLSASTTKFNTYPFAEEGQEIDKIQFRFEGELSNTYRYHDSGGPGMTQSYSSNDNRIYYNTQDTKLTNSGQRVEADRNGLYNKKLAQARHVEWFTNQEMASGVPQSQGKIIGYQEVSANGMGFSGYNYAPSKIGAFAVTSPDGTMYHYSLPVYNNDEYYFRGVTGQEATKYAETSNPYPYATSWLLTAITGPDFVDQGINGQLDKSDLGYWVKFSYGRLTQNYRWRFPYVGYTIEDGVSSYSKGRRDAYYLNSVQTRTHTALFFKGIRKDGRATYRRSSTGGNLPGMNPTDDVHPASSLLLQEIALLNNSDYETLLSQGFSTASQAGRNATAAFLNAPAAAQSSTTSSLEDLYDIYDIALGSSFRNFITQKATRRIVFNTSYQLCPGTLNSFENAVNPPNLDGDNINTGRLGKLTLNSVSCYGPNGFRLMPDFKFQYNTPNPSYSKDKWDGWGAYNSNGASSHVAAYSDPTSWHLTDIITPLGGRTRVAYERDDYGSVSNEPIRQKIPISGFSTNGFDATHGFVSFNTSSIAPYSLNTLLSNGAQITFKNLVAKQQGNCWDFGGSWPAERDYAINNNQIVQNVSSNGFVIQRPLLYSGHGNSLQGCGQCAWTKMSGYIEVTMPQKKGGNVRVASLSAVDEANNTYNTLYRYTLDGSAQGSSSGVVAQEPAFVSTVDYDFYHLFDFPNTGVLYKKVHVLEGVKDDGTYTSRTEYNFTTPRSDMVLVQNTVSEILNTPETFRTFRSHIENAKRYYYDIACNTSQIGRLENIQVYDNYGNVVAKSIFDYTSLLPNNQGTYTAGSILSEIERAGQCDENCPNSHLKFIRTNKTYYPNVLQRVRSTSKEGTSTQQNVSWDFLTGNVLESIQEDALGTKFKSVSVPAYVRYPNLRTKAENSNNKNILTPITQSSIYKLDINNSNQELLGASAQTWSSSWTKRMEANGVYSSVAAIKPIWIPQASYVWRPPFVRPNGGTAVANFTEFNWTPNAIQHSSWQKVGELGQVNEYSFGTETQAVLSDATSAVKYGYNNSQVICRAQNARYGEIAYSGAEDGKAGNAFFGGEVGGAVSASTDVSHTGNYSVKVTASAPKGFTFSTPIGVNEGAKVGRTYQASVWVYSPNTTASDGRLVATLLNGSSPTTLSTSSLSTMPAVLRAGAWCLLQTTFTVPASSVGKRIEVSCQTVAGTTYFDDFRVAPINASLSSYVYDTQSWNPTFVLDQNNLFSQMEYNERGQLFKTYKEVLSPNSPRKLVAMTTTNYSRDRKYTISASVASGAGSITPAGVSTLYVGDDIVFQGTTSSCSWTMSNSFQVDNVNYFSGTTLQDGTQFRIVGNDLIVSDLRGNHSINLNFDDNGYPPQGLWIEQYCETNSAGCYTGNTIWMQTDGCGGYMNQEVRRASNPSQCVNPPGSGCGEIVQE